MDYEYILVEQRGPALWVTLNRPAALNSLSLALAEELAAARGAGDPAQHQRTSARVKMVVLAMICGICVLIGLRLFAN